MTRPAEATAPPSANGGDPGAPAPSVLARIDSPADLKRLTPDELRRLAAEIRERLVAVVSTNGGHLAPGLGAVELTLALHRVFDSPRDKIVWDVGHQTYPHKIVTGRRDAFVTLRTHGGIAGFPRMSESPHDAFGTAHASTSISAALGFAVARDLAGEDHHVVAVIGDGGLTGGLAFEGLNQVGYLKKDLLVVLNDNAMSIAPNVGALSRYLTRVVSGPLYRTIEADVWHTLGHVPRIGQRLRAAAHRAKEAIKKPLLPEPGLFFEDLGFRYFGPVDGHDLDELLLILERLKNVRGPVLLHVRTVKGKGYAFAEADACKFHGVGAFDRGTGKSGSAAGGPPTWTDVFGTALTELAARDPRIVAITAAMPDGTGLTHFQRAHPDRFFDVGIAEPHAITFAAGLAAGGLRPVAAIYSTFLQRAYDQVVHDVAVQNLPVVFAVDRAGLVGEDGATHHGVFDLAFLRCVPRLVIACPRNEDQLRHLLFTALRHDGPFVLRYPRGAAAGVPLDAEMRAIPIGSWEALSPVEGADVALLATGAMVQVAEKAAALAAAAGVRAAVIDARFVKPLDDEMLARAVRGSRVVVTIEDHVLAAGFGSAVLEAAQRLGLDASRIHSLGVPDRFVDHGTRARLLGDVGLTPQAVADRVLSLAAASAPDAATVGSAPPVAAPAAAR